MLLVLNYGKNGLILGGCQIIYSDYQKKMAQAPRYVYSLCMNIEFQLTKPVINCCLNLDRQTG